MGATRLEDINTHALEIYESVKSLEQIQHNLDLMESGSDPIYRGTARIVEILVGDINRHIDQILQLTDQ